MNVDTTDLMRKDSDERAAPPWRIIGCLAVLTGLIYLYPTALYWTHHSSRYFPSTTYDEDYYAALASTTANGRPLTANPFLENYPARGRIGNEALMFLPRLATAGLIRATNLGIAFGAISFLSAFLIFPFVWAIVRDHTRSELWGYAGACGLLLLPFYLPPLAVLARSLVDLFHHGGGFKLDFEGGARYGRRYNPALSAILFYVFLWLHWKAVETGRRSKAVFAGVVGGLLCYAYLFFAVTGALISLLWVMAALWKKHSPRESLLLFGVQSCVALPFLVIILRNAGMYGNAFLNMTHAPFFPTTDILAALAPVTALVFLRGLGRNELWLCAVVLGSILAMNSQVITGVSIEPWHYDTYLVIPLSLLAVCITCPALLLHWPRISRTLGVVIVALAILLGFAGQSHALDNSPIVAAAYPDALDSLYKEIRATTASTGVLLIGEDVGTASWMVAATGRPVFVSFYAASYPERSPNEYRKRALCYYWLKGYDAAGFASGPASDDRSYVYSPEGFRYWFHSLAFTDQVKQARTQEFQSCLGNPRSCCQADLRADWLVESSAAPFDRSRITELYLIGDETKVGNYQISSLHRR